MLHDNLAKPITNTAAKAFQHHYDPDKPTFKLIFFHHWESFLAACKAKNIVIPEYKKYEVERTMACGTLDMGFEVYECPNCHRHHIVCYTCKSRFCNSCGTKMVRQRAFRIANSSLTVRGFSKFVRRTHSRISTEPSFLVATKSVTMSPAMSSSKGTQH